MRITIDLAEDLDVADERTPALLNALELICGDHNVWVRSVQLDTRIDPQETPR